MKFKNLFIDMFDNVPFSDKYEFYKAESLIGIGAIIICIIFTFILYNEKIHLFMYCLSWYLILCEIPLIINMKRYTTNK